ncbi:hypothetical protein [Thiomicrorhabdus aquaedulcis]|uniref:hypothetical protein n=1 Tax=Thiomicrorhabdus aquaedulcis TaxID=2211106 RepID=UPI000FD88243|nr:hypothetical protein [Thiomicrorhabdus aquaedulcis]
MVAPYKNIYFRKRGTGFIIFKTFDKNGKELWYETSTLDKKLRRLGKDTATGALKRWWYSYEGLEELDRKSVDLDFKAGFLNHIIKKQS